MEHSQLVLCRFVVGRGSRGELGEELEEGLSYQPQDGHVPNAGPPEMMTMKSLVQWSLLLDWCGL